MQEREGGKTGTADNSLEGYLQPRRHAAWRRNCRPGKQTRKVDHVHAISQISRLNLQGRAPLFLT
ncbi:MAG: hypothetical protein DMG39_29880, partial [Acidobacteria bacterium]